MPCLVRSVLNVPATRGLWSRPINSLVNKRNVAKWATRCICTQSYRRWVWCCIRVYRGISCARQSITKRSRSAVWRPIRLWQGCAALGVKLTVKCRSFLRPGSNRCFKSAGCNGQSTSRFSASTRTHKPNFRRYNLTIRSSGRRSTAFASPHVAAGAAYLKR